MGKENKFWFEKIFYLNRMKNFYSEISYKDINLWPVMAGDVYTYYYFSHLNKNEEPTRKGRILINLKSLFFRDVFPLKGKGNILVSYFMPRKDHHELVTKAVSSFPEKNLVWMDAFDYKQKSILKRGRFVFPDFQLLFNIWGLFRRNKLKKVLRNYYWFYIFKTYFRCKQISDLKNIFAKLSIKAHLSFCSSAFSEEAILTMLAKNKGVPTFTLQHGFLPKKEDAFTSVALQNENAISDYMMVWGKESYYTLKGYSNGTIPILAGNPKYKIIKKKPNKNFKPKKATILFSVPAFNEGNVALLRIVKRFIERHPEITFNITTHPMNDINLFSKELRYKNVKIIFKNISAQKILEESDFVILYNTSVAIEALNYKIPIFRYKGKKFISFWNQDKDTFASISELERLFSQVKKKRNYQDLMRFYDKILKNIFYFHPKKSVPQVYYEEIKKRI